MGQRRGKPAARGTGTEERYGNGTRMSHSDRMEEEQELTSSRLLCFFLVSIAGLMFDPGDSGLMLLE